jgi:hypothetical protein
VDERNWLESVKRDRKSGRKSVGRGGLCQGEWSWWTGRGSTEVSGNWEPGVMRMLVGEWNEGMGNGTWGW